MPRVAQLRSPGRGARVCLASRNWIVALVLAAAAGCGGSHGGVGGRPGGGASSPGSPECGALGQVCIGAGLDGPLALGARYDVSIAHQIGGSSGPPTQLESTDPAVLAVTDTSVEAVGLGSSALLFVGPDKSVLDFIQVWVARTDELRIMRYASDGTLLGRVEGPSQLLVGDEILVSVEPFADGQPLLGTFELFLGVSGESVDLVPDPVPGWYRVLARQAGRSTVTLSALGLALDWPIEVLP